MWFIIPSTSLPSLGIREDENKLRLSNRTIKYKLVLIVLILTISRKSH